MDGDEAGTQVYKSDSITPIEEYVIIGSCSNLTFVRSYRFMLYRHWNLYDSMYYSRYVATNLGIWKQNGKRKLDTLLAKMGLPLDECRFEHDSDV